MRVLLVGGGGREHALGKAVVRGGGTLLVAMKHRNPALARLAASVLRVDEASVDKVADWAAAEKADLAVIGPEAPLAAGVVDALQARGIPAVGPTQRAAEVEASKAFARDLMRRHAVPGLIEYGVFDDAAAARAYVLAAEFDVVVKPAGLTGGKGVQVMGDHLQTREDAAAYAEQVVRDRIGGSPQVVVEQKVTGEEFSLQAISDGKRVTPFPAVQDYKRAYDGDRGPNTGGMGSISQADGLLPFLRKEDYRAAVDILQRTVDALTKEDRPFRGVLYGGFIVTAQGVKVLEFNARFGDPEAMNVLPLLDEDFLDVAVRVVDGRLPPKLRFRALATVCRYVVPEGYGEKPRAGEEVHVDERAVEAAGAELFYAAVDEKDGVLRTTSSRALAVVGRGTTVEEANGVAERALAHVSGRVRWRRDIGTAAFLEARRAAFEAIRGGSRPSRA